MLCFCKSSYVNIVFYNYRVPGGYLCDFCELQSTEKLLMCIVCFRNYVLGIIKPC